LYCDQAVSLDAAQHARALRLADAAFLALLDLLSGSATTSDDGDLDGYRMGDSRFSRAEVHQAAGMVMADLGVTIEEATVRLHGYAFANDRPLIDVARDIVGRTLRLDDDNDEHRSGMEERP
jgi:hypothetical protein